MPEPIRLAFLGCGFITRVHSQHLQTLRQDITVAYASRDRSRADEYCRRFQGAGSYADYAAAIGDPRVDAVVVAVPPRFHLELTLQALAAGKHVLVEKPAFPSSADFQTVIDGAQPRRFAWCSLARTTTISRWRSRFRRELAGDAIGDMVFAHFVTIARKLKPAGDWRNDESMAGGRRLFRRGHPLAASRRKSWPEDHEHRGLPSLARAPRARHRRRPREKHDGGVPLRQRRRGLALLLARSALAAARAPAVENLRAQRRHHLRIQRHLRSGPRQGRAAADVPGFRDMRGYQAMYRDFVSAIRERRAPEMSVERALDDQRLMEQL
jgi:hypothetical protein